MPESRVLVLDVGGTTFTAAVMNESLQPVGSTVERPSREDQSRINIIDAIEQTVVAALGGGHVDAVTVCIPGPFDYESGTSLMRHKFAGLRGLALGPIIGELAGAAPLFINDADAAAIGVWSSEPPTNGVTAVVTLGTGVGSALVDATGSIVGSGNGSSLWDMDFADGVFEDAVSSIAIRRAFAASGAPPADVRQIAELARAGNEQARSVFTQFGADLGVGMARYYRGADLSRIVLSGKIAQSWDLFSEPTTRALRTHGRTTEIFVSLLEVPALRGGAVIGFRGIQDQR